MRSLGWMICVRERSLVLRAAGPLTAPLQRLTPERLVVIRPSSIHTMAAA